MSKKIINRARMSITGTPGTGDVSLNTATSGYQTFANAGLANGDTFPYVIDDGGNWEIGLGTYHSAGPSFTRTTVRASSGGGTSLISASSSAVVYSSIMGEDIPASVTTLAALTGDVNISSPTDAQVLTYDIATSKWKNAAAAGGGGGVGGTAPAFVQFKCASSSSGLSSGITMDTAPTNGNLLIAMTLSDSNNPSAGSGWTMQNSGALGTNYYNNIFSKVAGASESATQVPCSSLGGHCSTGIWEISGQNGSTPVLTSIETSIAAALLLSVSAFKAIPGSMFLCQMCFNSGAADITNVFGVTTDGNLAGGAGARPAYGHSDSSESVYGMGITTASSTSGMADYILIKH